MHTGLWQSPLTSQYNGATKACGAIFNQKCYPVTHLLGTLVNRFTALSSSTWRKSLLKIAHRRNSKTASDRGTQSLPSRRCAILRCLGEEALIRTSSSKSMFHLVWESLPLYERLCNVPIMINFVISSCSIFSLLLVISEIHDLCDGRLLFFIFSTY